VRKSRTPDAVRRGDNDRKSVPWENVFQRNLVPPKLSQVNFGNAEIRAQFLAGL
jgi:hypothetical protein